MKNGHGGLAELLELMEDIDYALLTTRAKDGFLVSRPLSTQTADPDGTLWFFVSDHSRKAEEIAIEPRVNLAYSAPDKNTYISIAGVASIEKDQAKIDELWSDALSVFFPGGRDDPELALLKVTIHRAEYWDGPSTTLGKAWKFITAAVSDKPADMGDHGTVSVR